MIVEEVAQTRPEGVVIGTSATTAESATIAEMPSEKSRRMTAKAAIVLLALTRTLPRRRKRRRIEMETARGSTALWRIAKGRARVLRMRAKIRDEAAEVLAMMLL